MRARSFNCLGRHIWSPVRRATPGWTRGCVGSHTRTCTRALLRTILRSAVFVRAHRGFFPATSTWSAARFALDQQAGGGGGRLTGDRRGLPSCTWLASSPRRACACGGEAAKGSAGQPASTTLATSPRHSAHWPTSSSSAPPLTTPVKFLIVTECRQFTHQTLASSSSLLSALMADHSLAAGGVNFGIDSRLITAVYPYRRPPAGSANNI